ncbi:hypothetical protein MKW94_024872, partial [Papaver nudicaule]|nr:hypothetical protein [Papaver nudicaule]
KEAKADYGQKMKEAVEYRKLARPTLEQAFESIDPIHFLRIHKENLDERINSMSLAGRNKIISREVCLSCNNYSHLELN